MTRVRASRAAVGLCLILVTTACRGSSPAPPAPAPTTAPTVASTTTTALRIQHYAALGDSYAAGEGLAPFEADSGGCRRSPLAYPRLVAAQEGATLTFGACTGAVTADLENQPVPAGTDLVTVTIGGNDAGFGTVVGQCVLIEACSSLDAQVESALSSLQPQLESAYKRLRARAPSAAVLVVGYPQVVADPAVANIDACPEVASPIPGLRITADEARWLRDKGTRLDGVVAAAARNAGVRYVDVRAAFAGHEACSGDPWLSGVVLGNVRASFHPTAIGQAQLAALVGRALR